MTKRAILSFISAMLILGTLFAASRALAVPNGSALHQATENGGISAERIFHRRVCTLRGMKVIVVPGGVRKVPTCLRWVRIRHWAPDRRRDRSPRMRCPTARGVCRY